VSGGYDPAGWLRVTLSLVNHMAITQSQIATGLCDVGLQSGDIILIHSAMRTLGRVDGGAATVVDALLEVIGEQGTLVAPTFTFIHEPEDDPIIDPATDKSEMGAITEAVRLHPDALRSTAYRHSFAAIGRRAVLITDVDPKYSVFDVRSSFGVMLALNTKVLLLGVNYSNSTSHHFAEWLCEVPYRHTIDMNVKVKQPDGTIVQQPMIDYQPFGYGGTQHTDFNRLGQIQEDRETVSIGAIGNSIVRLFSLRDLVDIAQEEAEKDYNIFRNPEGEPDSILTTGLGTTIDSPPILDGAGRPGHCQWCVVNEADVKLPE